MECVAIELAFKVETPEDNELAKTWCPDNDVIIYSGEITGETVLTIINILESKCVAKRLLLILATPGGDVDAAYRLARFCQSTREHFAVSIFGECKSAGTLFALGAHELVLGKSIA
jgi:ClpP class serine protease